VSPDTGLPMFSNRLALLFADAVTQEVGAEKIPSILAGSQLSPSQLEKNLLAGMDGMELAKVYASVQQALRLFYGRGARGILIRIGQGMWDRTTAQANFREKTELEIARRFPVPARRRRILNLVAGHLREGGGATSIHTLDLDLLLVDHSAAATVGQSSTEPICFVTLGLIGGALLWATGKEADIEEIACKAAGAPACEFKVKLGGK
jgi:predicted hydrocarbon binding protein